MRRIGAASLGFLMAGLMAGCAAGPEVASDRSAVYGVVTARPHSQVLAKWTQASPGGYGSPSGTVVNVPSEAIDYASLTGMYVGLVDPGYGGGADHAITFSKTAARPESLAVAVGDVIRVRNATGGPLTIFLAAIDSEAIQDAPTIPAGGSGEIRVRIEGLLELGADEDDRPIAPVLARRGLRTSEVASGGSYVFNDLEPGAYRMIFWYWRLGSIERSVTLAAGRASRLDEVLSVDRTVR